LFGAAEKTMGKLVFRDAAMKSVFGGRMPRVVKSFATADRLVVVLGKTADQVLLRDLIAHCGGRLDPKHVAWIVSDLESIASYLGMPSVGVVHPAFGPDTLLVSPKFHSVTVAGGWWYAAAEGTKLTAAPGRAVAHIPPAILSAGSAGARAMLEMVRLTACEALGHSGPVLVQRDPLVPPPLKRWLLDPPMETAVDDYKSWGVAREASFGPRRFVELAVDPEEIYRRI
jgi:hypothetical protein